MTDKALSIMGCVQEVSCGHCYCYLLTFVTVRIQAQQALFKECPTGASPRPLCRAIGVPVVGRRQTWHQGHMEGQG